MDDIQYRVDYYLKSDDTVTLTVLQKGIILQPVYLIPYISQIFKYVIDILISRFKHSKYFFQVKLYFINYFHCSFLSGYVIYW